MKKVLIPMTCCALALAIASCNTGSQQSAGELNDSVEVTTTDSALYGTVGEGTTMHVLELITEDGKTMELAIDQDSLSDVQGGIFAGDRVTLTTNGKVDDMPQVGKLINLTSLLGKWTSLDRNFEIQEDGVIESSQKAESDPYTQWSTVNARLILNRDTFDVVTLGPDSLSLENDKGIFVYKRLGKVKE